MTRSRRVFLPRRRFLASAAATGLCLGLHTEAHSAAPGGLEVGEGRLEITPPPGTLLCGFHYRPNNERRSEGVRQPTFARALVLRHSDSMAAILSVDLAAVSQQMADRVAHTVAASTKIPAGHVRLCATHTHSAPTGRFARQWGGLPEQYLGTVEARLGDAVQAAVNDLAPARLSVGKTTAPGANFNRTTDTWKTEDQFDASASDADRWLDRVLHVLRFERDAKHRDLLWYHFSAHPVCFTDRLAGPDWPGVVSQLLVQDKLSPSLLQGHCGDVNPGDGSRWLGRADDTGKKVADAIRRAIAQAEPVKVDQLRVNRREVSLPLDTELHQQQMDLYRKDPAANSRGEFVDAPFARAWFASMSNWEVSQRRLPITISAMRLGPVGLFFHPSELFSYYGLSICHQSPLEHMLAVGYTDGFIGYLTDPTSHEKREYAATIVPKVLDLPPYKSTAAREFTSQAVDFLKTAMI